MRTFNAIACVTLLSACTAADEPNPLPDSYVGAFGAIIAVGENWRLQGDPAHNSLSVSVDDGAETSGTWVHPHYVEGRISASDIRVTLENDVCELHNVTYPMRATVTFPGHTLQGCAAIRWDNELSELIDEIDACIAFAPSFRSITYAGEISGGSVIVRARDGETAQDCRVKGGRAELSPRNETLAFPTENAAILLRARPGETQNPGGDCYEAPEALIYRGHPAWPETVGWWLDPEGC